MRLLVLLGALLAGSLPAQDAPLPVRTKVDLVALQSHAVPGQTLRLAFRFRCDPHFHIYWINPGDAGEAPKWTWMQDGGLRFGETRWPAPIRIDLAGVLNFCYEGETHLFVDAQVPADAKGALRLKAKVEWLECDDKGCYPQEKVVELEVPVGPAAEARLTPSVQASLDRLPAERYVVQGRPSADGSTLRLTETLSGRALGTVLRPEEFFPLRAFVAAATKPGPVAMTAAPAGGSSSAQAFTTLSLKDAPEGLADGPLGYVALVKDNRSGKSRWVTVVIELESPAAPAGPASPQKAEPAPPAKGPGALEWRPWSPEAQAKALADGKVVYVDFTARWCATCQVNKRVYADGDLGSALARSEVVLLKADWDKRDEVIRAELARYGRQGIPLNVFLRQGADPVVLPEILTPLLVREGLAAVREGGRLEVAESSAAWMLILAVVGGAILNLMPCVFPVIGLKVLAFAGQAGGDRAVALRQSLAYAAGVILSFLALGGLILALKSGGAAVGWGFQMQSPGFVLGTAALMVMLGMSLAGAYEIGTGVASAAGGGDSGAFLSGVLATAVATPCTAPGLGAALGYALDDRRGPAETLAFFAVIGLGMALPYVLLVAFPSLARRLPRPGEWMETLKQAMAFPLFAYALYLLWVLGAQVDDAAWVRDAGVGMALVAAACWAWGRWGAPHRSDAERRWGRLAAAALLAGTLAHLYAGLPD